MNNNENQTTETYRYSIDQQRAETAFKFVKTITNESYKKKYKSYVKKIPSLIKTNGLSATYAFVFSKIKKNNDDSRAYGKIYIQTKSWLQNEKSGFNYIFENEDKNEELVNIFIKQDSSEYRALTLEVLALFNWMRRFAEGLIQGEDNE